MHVLLAHIEGPVPGACHLMADCKGPGAGAEAEPHIAYLSPEPGAGTFAHIALVKASHVAKPNISRQRSKVFPLWCKMLQDAM